MKKHSLLFLFLFLFLSSVRSQTWEMVWNDEFDSTAVNTQKWNFDIGNGCEINLCGWGNNEKEYYRKENVSLSNGLLTITAKQEKFNTFNYTSGRINSSGKASWKYGKFEARIKMSKGQGLWHAFWMLPQDQVYGGWPRSGEIDIMEYMGQKPGMIQATIHYGDPWPNNKYSYSQKFASDFSTDFHTYTVIWEEEKLEFYVDSTLIGVKTPQTIAPYKWPFDQRFYFIINTAVGGNLTDNYINNAILPGYMQVDYVRVYKWKTEFDSVQVKGPQSVCNGDTTYLYTATKGKNWIYTWTVPVGGKIVKGQGTDSLTVDLSKAVSGIVTLKLKNDTSGATKTFKYAVIISSCDTIKRYYGSGPAVIPGKVEAENFDNGGQGRAYSDLDLINNGKTYRNEGVDIESTSDAGGGYNIGWSEAEEWLEYSVWVKKTAKYDFTVRASSPENNRTVSIFMDDSLIIDAFPISNTGGWQNFESNIKSGIPLDSGLHVMRFKFNTGSINLNFINIQETVKLGLKEVQEEQVRLVPNPASTEVFIQLPTGDYYTISVLTVTGQEVIRSEKYQPETKIDVSALPAGIYLIQGKSEKSFFIQKFVKK